MSSPSAPSRLADACAGGLPPLWSCALHWFSRAFLRARAWSSYAVKTKRRAIAHRSQKRTKGHAGDETTGAARCGLRSLTKRTERSAMRRLVAASRGVRQTCSSARRSPQRRLRPRPTAAAQGPLHCTTNSNRQSKPIGSRPTNRRAIRRKRRATFAQPNIRPRELVEGSRNRSCLSLCLASASRSPTPNCAQRRHSDLPAQSKQLKRVASAGAEMQSVPPIDERPQIARDHDL